MTLRPLTLGCLLALACAPAASTTSPDQGSEDGTGSSSDDTSTSGSSTTTESSATSGGDPSSEGSSDDGVDTTETGDDAMQDGLFEIAAQGATQTPDGCAGADEGPPKGWTLDFMLPGAGASFMATETFGPHVSQYECTLADASFSCVRDTEVDYGRFSGMDAVVTLATSYEAAWDGDRLVGTYDADFACTGSACASVVEEWNLATFPCGLEVPFVATAAPGR